MVNCAEPPAGRICTVLGEIVPVLPSVMGSPLLASRTEGVTSQLPVQPVAQGELPVTALSQARLMAASVLLRSGFGQGTAAIVWLGGRGGDPTNWLFCIQNALSLVSPSREGIWPVNWLSLT